MNPRTPTCQGMAGGGAVFRLLPLLGLVGFLLLVSYLWTVGGFFFGWNGWLCGRGLLWDLDGGLRLWGVIHGYYKNNRLKSCVNKRRTTHFDWKTVACHLQLLFEKSILWCLWQKYTDEIRTKHTSPLKVKQCLSADWLTKRNLDRLLTLACTKNKSSDRKPQFY